MAEKERKTLPFPTPFGKVGIPVIQYPSPIPKYPKVDMRFERVLRNALGVDLSDIIGLIPIVGEPIADVLRDTHGKEIYNNLTPEEWDTYSRHNKVLPSIVAALRTLIEKE